MDTIIDSIDKTNISSTQQAKIYSFSVPQNSVFIVRQVSIGIDSNFVANGKMMAKVGDKFITSQNSAPAPIGMIANLNVDYPPASSNPLLWKKIDSGEAVAVWAHVTTASGIIQVSVIGDVMTEDEFKALLRSEGL